MAVRNDFAAGEVLAAADLNDTFASKVDYALTANAQSGTGASAYTFVLADASRLTTATGTSAKTFTIPPQTSVTWIANSIIRVANYGAGDLTIAGGSGVTVTNASKTLAQYESAALVRTGSNAWTLIPFSGGAGNADFSDAATGTYTDGGVSYKYVTFTASGTLTVTKAGFADILVVSGGGGTFANSGGGGAGGVLQVTNAYLGAGSLTVTVGAGGTNAAAVAGQGQASRLGSFYSVGGGCPHDRAAVSSYGGSGGGGSYGGFAGYTGTPGLGNNGGTGATSSCGGGGGAGAVGGNSTTNVGGNGGAGIASSITGSSVTYGGGGGGWGNSTGGSGGAGGGGAGGAASGQTAGGANTGGGAGSSNAGGTNGGSGIVIVRVRTS